MEWSIIHILREENMEADALANLGLSTKRKGSDSVVVVQLLHSILDMDDYCDVNSTSLIWDWIIEFIKYLRHEKLPEDPKTSRAVRLMQLVTALLIVIYIGDLSKDHFLGA